MENHGGLLANLGPHAPELLTTRPSDCSRHDLDQLDRASELFLDAHRLGAQIECKEELIVYMSLDDWLGKSGENPKWGRKMEFTYKMDENYDIFQVKFLWIFQAKQNPKFCHPNPPCQSCIETLATTKQNPESTH